MAPSIDRLRQFLRDRLEMDWAVVYAVASRAWQMGAGVVTLLLVARFFTREMQGYFYTFWSLVGLQWLLELGFTTPVLNGASHEWTRLRLDDGELAGDPTARSRLISLGRRMAGWFVIASGLFAVIVGPIGVHVLSTKENTAIEWLAPWCWFVVLNALAWTMHPLHTVLEGCNQVIAVHRMRLLQAISGNLVAWTCIVLGFQLWTLVAIAVVKLVWDAWLPLVRYRRFFRAFWRPPPGPAVDWPREMRPRQWRMAVQGIANNVALGLFNPLMFRCHGPVVAGQLGMTLSVLMALQAAAASWIQTRAPRLGMLVARREFDELDLRFRRITGISFAVLAIACVTLLAGVWGLTIVRPELAHRFVTPTALAALGLAITLQHLPTCLSIYVWAHQRDAVWKANVLSSTLIVVMTGWLGLLLGPLGVGLGWALVVAMVNIPLQIWFWRQCRVR